MLISKKKRYPRPVTGDEQRKPQIQIQLNKDLK